jgi:predicted nuclease of restriction endonuclease-like RecB superfamily
VIPWSLVRPVPSGDEVVLRYLREQDTIWLRGLLDAYARFVGRRRRLLDEYLQAPLPAACEPRKLKQARHVLDRLWTAAAHTGPKPRLLREKLFTEASTGAAREVVLRRAARRLDLTPRQLEEGLFDDLPAEQRLGPPPAGLDAGELALHVNLAQAQGLLRRARAMRLELEGNARAVVSQAKWCGLMCTAWCGSGREQIQLELSGPMALFRRAQVYGRALAGLIPPLAGCNRFRLEARCDVDGDPRRFVLRSGDPVFPATPPRRFDSRLEERFHRDFGRAAPDWDLIREPEPLPAGDTLIFPDFALVHRRHRWRRWLLEIMGFWTPDYVDRKLAHLRAARCDELILCLDADRDCGQGELPSGARLVPFRRRIDPTDVLRIIDHPFPNRRG